MGMSPKQFAEVISDFVRPLREKVATLERELADVKKSIPVHRGKFEKGAVYDTGQEVAWRGSTWRARYNNVITEPPSDGWILVARGVAHHNGG